MQAAHSYILLKDKDNSCHRGRLLKLRSDGSYSHHRHSRLALPLGIRCSADEVAALSEEECVLLDGIDSEADRYTVYSTPGKLKWGCGLKVGDTVLAQLPRRSGRGTSSRQYITSIIRWCGQTQYGCHIYGVEITVSSRNSVCGVLVFKTMTV